MRGIPGVERPRPLEVDADAETTSSLGTVRGQLIADGLPATVAVTGKFGSQSHIHVAN